MAGDANDLLYQYEGIDTVKEAIMVFVKTMNENLNEVDAKFKNLIANGWHGAGADAFEGESRKWHMSANEMAETLNNLGITVGDAAINMRETDIRLAGLFGGTA
jgi:WXG100 family type VII secretion target